MVIGGAEVALPNAAGESEAEAVAFVRPHDIRVSREPGGPRTFAARILRSNAAGPVANLELERVVDGGLFTVQLSKEEYQSLALKAGEQVFVELKNVRVFGEDYSI